MNRKLAEIIVLDAALLLAPAAAIPAPPYPMINVTTSPYNAVGDALMGLTDCSLTSAHLSDERRSFNIFNSRNWWHARS